MVSRAAPASRSRSFRASNSRRPSRKARSTVRAIRRDKPTAAPSRPDRSARPTRRRVMIRTWRRRFVAALFICNAGAATAATDNSRPCEREMARASQQHGIPLGILYAVALPEPGGRGALHPYALGADGQPVFAKFGEYGLSIGAE